MAPQPGSARSPPGNAAQPVLIEKDLSLAIAPAIFTPFAGPSKTPIPHPNATQDRLETIITNLHTQQDAVRRNMLYLLELRAKALTNQTQAAIERLGNEDDGISRFGNYGVEEKEAEAMMARVKTSMRKGGRGEEVEVKPGCFDSKPPGNGNGNRDRDSEGDIMMTNTTGPREEITTAAQMKRKLKLDLQELPMRGAAAIEAYDAHAHQTTRHYKEYLERGIRAGRFHEREKPRGGASMRGRERGVGEEVRRTGTGMLVAGVQQVESPMRVSEGFEELVRRGSK